MTHCGWGRHRRGHCVHYGPEKIKRALEVAKQLPRKPKSPGVTRVVAGLDEHGGIRSRVSWGIAHAPYLALVDIVDGRVVDMLVVSNPLADMRGGVGVAVARWLVDNDVDVVVAGRIGPHALEVISAKKIQVVQPQPREALDSVLRRIGLLA